MICVTDTYPLALHLLDKHKKLGRQARRIYDQVAKERAVIVIPTICLVEILELTELGKLRLAYSFRVTIGMLQSSRFYQLEPLTGDIVITTSVIPVIREERDRLIVATALTLNYPLITNDQAVIESRLVETVWE